MTAVEWLHNKWGNCKVWKWEEIEQWFEQAKEMEKQQIIEISDEEIEKAVNEYANVYQCPSELKMCKHDVISAWNNAIKWYREQLKKKL